MENKHKISKSTPYSVRLPIIPKYKSERYVICKQVWQLGLTTKVTSYRDRPL